MVFVTLPMRARSVAVGGSSVSGPAPPDVPVHVPSGVMTRAITPGNPARARVSSRTACRAAWVSAAIPASAVGLDVAAGSDADELHPARASALTRTAVAMARRTWGRSFMMTPQGEEWFG